MKNKEGVPISTTAAVTVPAAHALPALETILTELTKRPGSTSLALAMHEVHIPLQAMISVPVQAQVLPGKARNDWRLEIRAASKSPLYPTFAGNLTLSPASERSCELSLHGSYSVPLDGIGRAIDATLLRGAAQASIDRFVREIAHRAATLARWAKLP